MTHSEYIRIVPGSRNTILLIHGIVGTPHHFDFLLPVIPEDWNIYNLLLDGHGHGVREFAKTSMEKWRSQVSSRLDEIAAHSDQVVIVGHSMGTLFAIQEAIRHPALVQQLVLLAVPLYPVLRPAAALAALKLSLGLGAGDAIATAMGTAGGVALTPRLWQYLPWLPRFGELLRECRRTRQHLPQLTTPCFAFQSRCDELVSLRSCKLLSKTPAVTLTILEHSGHFVYGTEDARHLQEQLRRLLI